MSSRSLLVALLLALALAVAAAAIPGVAWWVAWLAAVNVVAAAAVALDKALARAGARRVPEATLLLLALAGASPGAWAAMEAARHKTAKASFRRRFRAILVLQALLAGALVVHHVVR